MFSVSEEAQKQIAEYFRNKDPMPVRVFLHQGCGGAQIAMAMDEKRHTDMVFKIAGVEYLVEKEFLKKAQPIAVDFINTGFKITSPMKLGGGCGGCGGAGSCCSQ